MIGEGQPVVDYSARGSIAKLEKRVEELERLTTGENGYMLINVPIGSYVLPPKEVKKQLKLNLKKDRWPKFAEKQFTKEDMKKWGRYYTEALGAPNRWENYDDIWENFLTTIT